MYDREVDTGRANWNSVISLARRSHGEEGISVGFPGLRLSAESPRLRMWTSPAGACPDPWWYSPGSGRATAKPAVQERDVAGRGEIVKSSVWSERECV